MEYEGDFDGFDGEAGRQGLVVEGREAGEVRRHGQLDQRAALPQRHQRSVRVRQACPCTAHDTRHTT